MLSKQKHARMHPSVIRSARTTIIRALRERRARLPNNVGGRRSWLLRIELMLKSNALLLGQPGEDR